MSTPTSAPWAILLCKLKNYAPEPPAVPPVPPFKTVCERFFTDPNAGFNAVRFFSDMSHGKIDLSSSEVLGWYTLDASLTGTTSIGDPILDKTQDEIMALAKQAAKDAGVDMSQFVGAVLILDLATGWAQGGSYSGIVPNRGMAADWRRVDGRNFDGTRGVPAAGGNGTEVFGQEMGHGFGLGHSRMDGSETDYQDTWDIMSTLNAYGGADVDYGARGPGMNAWNMRGRGWLDESRVWHCPNGDFSEQIELRPLHRCDLTGYLAAELPPLNDTDGFPRYLVEYRKQENWDIGIPRSCILVHRYQGGPIGDLDVNRNHSYIMRGAGGQFDLVAGDLFADNAGPFSRLRVISIDDANSIAAIQLCHSAIAWPQPTVKVVHKAGWDACIADAMIEGGSYTFGFRLDHTDCMPGFRILWSVTGAAPLVAQPDDSPQFSVLAPPAGVNVHVTVTVTFDDGTKISGTIVVPTISQQEGTIREFICEILSERLKPIPWWQWDPEKLDPILSRYLPKQREVIQQRLALFARNISAAIDLLGRNQPH
jgi:M6 family metalloprotease-like protein